MNISAGDRVRPPSKWYYPPTALLEERVGVVDCGPSMWVCSIPGGKFVPGSTRATIEIAVVVRKKKMNDGGDP